MCNKIFKDASVFSCVLCLVLVSTLAKSSENYAKNSSFKMEKGHLVEVPKRFDLSGHEVAAEFAKIVADINYLIKNASVSYRIKVDLPKTGRKQNLIKKKFEHSKKKHSNKFNVPLSKKNMKLSAYEMLMKKMAENDEPRQVNVIPVQMPTTEADAQVVTAKQISSRKYRPIIHKYKANYTRRIKPVKNDIITLIAKEIRLA